MREDNILFMISIRLKDLCNELGVFIMSATQLNGNYQDASLEESNQNLLRGAKSIADRYFDKLKYLSKVAVVYYGNIVNYQVVNCWKPLKTI